MSFSGFSRRFFLKQVSAAAAVGLLHQVPGRELWALPPDELMPEPDEALLRQLATTAVEAARAAGAGFADVRVTGGRYLGLGGIFDRRNVFGHGGQRPTLGPPLMIVQTAYGIRVIVDGVWGFAGGSVLTTEAVAEVARAAVQRARANRSRRPRALELAPAPRVENGRWATPIVRDPFTVPVREQADLVLAALTAAEGVRGILAGVAGFQWTRALRVFASSAGSLIVQRIALSHPGTHAFVRPQSGLDQRLESLRAGGYGYEAVAHMDFVAELRQAAERAAATRLPEPVAPSSVEVGRYDLVLGGEAVARLLRATLAPALNLERALGYRANREGTSFAAPPADVLGKYEIGSPLLTLRADRTRPHAFATVGWDDEGVPAGEHTLIEDGVIVDYLTSRQTAMELASSHRHRSEAMRSRGCASGAGDAWPEVRIPNLALAAGPEDISVEDLIADTKRGFYVPTCVGQSDQQLLSGQFTPGGGPPVREIRDGKLGRPISDFAFQFITPQFWKKLDALGGPKSMVDEPVLAVEFPTPDDILQLDMASVRAVPVRIRDVNVLNTGRTA